MKKKILIFTKVILPLLMIISFASSAKAADALDVATQIAEPYYEGGRQAALEYKELRTYSDHGIHHAKTVMMKSVLAGEAINEAIANNNVDYYSMIDLDELKIAAILHDTGMDGGTFKKYSDGNALRKDHSLNSAIHVLENRQKLEAAGVDVDAVALECMLHSKSCSGVRDLTNDKQWTDCFNRIDEAIKLYNAKYPQHEIFFNKGKWTNGKVDSENVYIFNINTKAKTAATAAALRIGDANREAAQYPYTQTGYKIYVDFDSYVPNAKSWYDEVQIAKIKLTGAAGETKPLADVSEDVQGYDRMYMSGEGNLSMDCLYNPTTKKLTEQFKVLHMASFPLSTQKCIEERLEELDTMKYFPVEAEIIFDVTNVSKLQLKRIKKSYSRYCKVAKRQHGFPVRYKFVKTEDNIQK